MKHQKGIKIKEQEQNEKSIEKFAQQKRLHHGRQRQVYMHDFMYIDLETMSV